MKLIFKTMEKTFENMDKLKSELFEAIDKICKDYETKQTPELKPGQWGAFKANNGNIYPFLIHHFEDHKVYGQDFKRKDDIYKVDYQTDRCNLISVTPDQIKDHLKSICDEKYIGKKVEDLAKTFNQSGEIVKSFKSYDKCDDKLWYFTENDHIIILYKQGKFAEIIPDKKKLPEGKEGFKQVYYDWLKLRNEPLLPFDAFIDQYDIS